jgi:K+/H+ antiporter YhaU regulatory subunit KhtT
MEIIKHPTDIQVIGIIKAGEKILNPSKSLLIESGDQLILLAEKITDFEEIENALLG